MDGFKFEQQDKPGDPWRDALPTIVRAVITREVGEELVEEVLNEMKYQHLPVMCQASGKVYRAVATTPDVGECQCEDCHCAREVGLMGEAA